MASTGSKKQLMQPNRETFALLRDSALGSSTTTVTAEVESGVEVVTQLCHSGGGIGRATAVRVIWKMYAIGSANTYHFVI